MSNSLRRRLPEPAEAPFEGTDFDLSVLRKRIAEVQGRPVEQEVRTAWKNAQERALDRANSAKDPR